MGKGVILDIIPMKDNPFVSKLKLRVFNKRTLNNEIIEIDSRLVSSDFSNCSFFYMVEKLSNTFFSNKTDWKSKVFLSDKLQCSYNYEIKRIRAFYIITIFTNDIKRTI